MAAMCYASEELTTEAYSQLMYKRYFAFDLFCLHGASFANVVCSSEVSHSP